MKLPRFFRQKSLISEKNKSFETFDECFKIFVKWQSTLFRHMHNATKCSKLLVFIAFYKITFIPSRDENKRKTMENVSFEKQCIQFQLRRWVSEFKLKLFTHFLVFLHCKLSDAETINVCTWNIMLIGLEYSVQLNDAAWMRKNSKLFFAFWALNVEPFFSVGNALL